ncbi:Coiled-coil domain-containing protein [Helicobacter suis]|uniref:Coiled-coil domain-containing protein n=1 Tax=Helicobacter suis TaxID=104628 RepID=UPI00159690E4|nr:Coiled-coil domain-containing protein [Helicobacter suis]BCD48471.1 Coiled-coil domain-containing protein [Helicobacter suis]
MPTLEDKTKELETLKNEISQAEASLEADFAKYAAENMDEKLEQLFFDNKEQFVQELLTMQNQFLKDKLGDKAKRASELHEEISTEQTKQELENIKEQFKQNHPEANMDDLIRFYNEDLPPKYRNQLDQLEGLNFFNQLYELYKAFSGEQNPENAQNEQNPENPDPNLPKRLNGNATSSPDQAPKELVMNRF